MCLFSGVKLHLSDYLVRPYVLPSIITVISQSTNCFIAVMLVYEIAIIVRYENISMINLFYVSLRFSRTLSHLVTPTACDRIARSSELVILLLTSLIFCRLLIILNYTSEDDSFSQLPFHNKPSHTHTQQTNRQTGLLKF